MPTDTYKPRHKKSRHPASSANRGPDRWARAAHNALVNPNSENARLYQNRVHLAVRFREAYARDETPVVFMKRAWNYDERRYDGVTRDYVTCSLYCAAMQIQLDYGARSVGDIANTLVGSGFVSVLDTTELARNMRCQVCGTTVEKK